MKAILLTLAILAQKIIMLFQTELLGGYVGRGKKMPGAIRIIILIIILANVKNPAGCLYSTATGGAEALPDISRSTLGLTRQSDRYLTSHDVCSRLAEPAGASM